MLSEKPLKQNVSISLELPVIEKIKELAFEDERSMSQYINMVLKEHIANRSKDKAQ